MRNENLLLASLPGAEREELSPYLKKVVLEFQQVLIEPNEEITDIYFPHDAITSTIQEMSDGASVETGLMGIEGFIGVQLWLRGRITPTRTLVQVPGEAYHMKASDFLRHVRDTDSSRGQMQIVDGDGLRNGSCECLEIIEKQLEKVFEHRLRDDLK